MTVAVRGSPRSRPTSPTLTGVGTEPRPIASPCRSMTTPASPSRIAKKESEGSPWVMMLSPASKRTISPALASWGICSGFKARKSAQLRRATTHLFVDRVLHVRRHQGVHLHLPPPALEARASQSSQTHEAVARRPREPMEDGSGAPGIPKAGQVVRKAAGHIGQLAATSGFPPWPSPREQICCHFSSPSRQGTRRGGPLERISAVRRETGGRAEGGRWRTRAPWPGRPPPGSSRRRPPGPRRSRVQPGTRGS